MNNNKIGLFILKLRKEKGLTQQELGDLLYVTDKAVSKWERGLSLPDIAVLKKLAEVLEVDVSEILNGEKTKKKNIDIEKSIQEATKQIKINQREKTKKMIIIIFIITICLIYIIFRNLNLGYSIKTINYNHSYTDTREIKVGIPKLSFIMKNRDYSYSFKNLRSSTVIENEVKRYLKTLKYSNCKDTIYYYNEEDNYSIIEYSVKNNFIYTTISYAIVDNDYCYTRKVQKYSDELNGLRRYRSLNNGGLSLNEKWDSKIEIIFIDGGNDNNKLYEFVGELTINYYKRTSSKTYNKIVLEESTGDIEIKDDKLHYYRKEIITKDNSINIPEVSTFKIQNGRLILIDNYLTKYYKEDIILK